MPDDTYKYFRIEAKELLESLTQGLLELEKGNFSRDLAGRLLRYAHTLKGAARIVNEINISEMSHKIEDMLSPYRAEGSSLIPSRDISELLRLTDEIARALPSLGQSLSDTAEKTEKSQSTAPPSEEGFETVRIELDKMDAFLNQMGRTVVYETGLKRELQGFDNILQKARGLAERFEEPRASSRSSAGARELFVELRHLQEKLIAANEKTEVELSRLQEHALELRLVPASSIFASLDRAARDAARSLDKKIDFHAIGGENRLDAHVLGPLRDALIHVVRNAVAHGIEPETRRLSSGKPAAGRVQVTVERRSNGISFTCEDDGRGVDVEQVRQLAAEKGLIPPGEAALQPQDAIQLLLHGGVTTSPTLTEISGRGIGLDVVRETMKRLKGEVSIQSEPGKGTVVNLLVPVSLETVNVIEVETGGTVVSVPFHSVLRGIRAGNSEVVRSERGNAILFEKKLVPFVPLISLIRPASRSAVRPQAWSVLIISVNSSLAAIGVDRLLRRTNALIRPLPKLAGRVQLIGGASLDSEGQPRLLIDPAAVVDAVGSGVRSAISASPPEKTPVLVIDDSLTTRMLEQSILETAGYDVSLAWSAEEALKKIQHRKYALFVVDVEMPGMNGFEFIEQIQSNTETRGIPSILVTSRDSIEDRRRGEQAGALGYIVKSEFNEGQLLSTIRRLIGNG